ncbi:hypothetical protein [Paenibacillus timonensis]|uniref:hypothetical protein n=1 Tax=Paenibacillus timonensis TaxID=225915 RepID=UPI0022E6FA93|nr:hypothetical protein [Paenibacillus timonensis]
MRLPITGRERAVETDIPGELRSLPQRFENVEIAKFHDIRAIPHYSARLWQPVE